MNEKDNFEFNFDEKVEDLFATANKPQEDEFEDIVSSSSAEDTMEFEDISSSSTPKGKEKGGFVKWWKKLSGLKKGLLITVTSLFLVLAIILGWGFTQFARVHVSINREELIEVPIKDENILNIALFGVDARDENVFSGNTDSIMVLSLNKKTKTVKIFSIMRDTLVPMDYKGEKYCAKINSAYSKSPEHAINTLNEVYDLDIQNYATVNFFGMRDIIDAVGGINATITDDELTWKGTDHPNLNGCMDEICSELGLDANDYYIRKAGEQKLNGVQAVAYARVRHCRNVWGTNNDFGRTDRQRYVMQELFNKATQIDTSEYLGLANALVPCTRTSLGIADIVSLATEILGHSPKFEQYRLPQAEGDKNMTFTFTGSGYGSVVYYDLDYAARMINAVIYDEMTVDEFIEENPIEKNDWYYDKTEYHGSSRPSGGSSGGSSTDTGSSGDSTTDNTTDNNEVTACVHTNTELRNAVASTVDTEGYSGDTYCIDCGALVEEGYALAKEPSIVDDDQNDNQDDNPIDENNPEQPNENPNDTPDNNPYQDDNNETGSENGTDGETPNETDDNGGSGDQDQGDGTIVTEDSEDDEEEISSDAAA